MKRSTRWTALFFVLGALVFAEAVQAQAKASFTVDAAKAAAGEKLFTAQMCAACHSIGKGKLVGPDLAGLLERRELAWVQKWLTQTNEMLATDSIAKRLFKESANIAMPQPTLKPEEVEALLHYMVKAGETTKK
ncbi:MAG: c-type cytochrome [Longimicrobiales bacterium]